jgi:malate synthase
VAHPDLVPVAMEIFNAKLGDKPNQLDRQRPEVNVSARDLLDIRVPNGSLTEAGLRTNVAVGILYLESWLRGVGAAALFNLMEDAATAEISRSQVWQWIEHGATLPDGRKVTRDLVQKIEEDELAKVREQVGADAFAKGRFNEARALFDQVALSKEFTEFLTLPAYEHIK